MSNLFDRHQNTRAQDKKYRAKARSAQAVAFFTPDQLNAPRFEALVIGNTAKSVTVKSEQGIFSVRKLTFHDLVPGDRVRLIFEEDEPIIFEQLERTSVLTRMNSDATRRHDEAIAFSAVAANIDLGVIVASATNPTLHPRFIDRYLLLLDIANIQPVLCITKSDLASRHTEAMALYRSLNIPIVEVSTVTGSGMDDLKAILRGKTAVFVGQSGVGKSSLVQTLIPDMEIQTQEVSEKTGTGKHTTTASGLYEWESGSMIIDTPGIRTLSIGHIPKDELRYSFREFDAYVGQCIFRDCLHNQEEDCAVKKAVASGEIAEGRYDSYLRMMEEYV